MKLRPGGVRAKGLTVRTKGLTVRTKGLTVKLRPGARPRHVLPHWRQGWTKSPSARWTTIDSPCNCSVAPFIPLSEKHGLMPGQLGSYNLA